MTTEATTPELPAWLNPDVINAADVASIADFRERMDDARSAIVDLAMVAIDQLEGIDTRLSALDLPDDVFMGITKAIGLDHVMTVLAQYGELLTAAGDLNRGKCADAWKHLEELTEGNQP